MKQITSWTFLFPSSLIRMNFSILVSAFFVSFFSVLISTSGFLSRSSSLLTDFWLKDSCGSCLDISAWFSIWTGSCFKDAFPSSANLSFANSDFGSWSLHLDPCRSFRSFASLKQEAIRWIFSCIIRVNGNLGLNKEESYWKH